MPTKKVRGKKSGETSEDPYAEQLRTLDKLAKCLRERRFKGGSVKFDREELHFDIDETGKPIRAYFKKSNDATQLIEEFMLLANKRVCYQVRLQDEDQRHQRSHL